MKAKEIRDLSVADLEKKSAELNQELFNLRFQLHTGHLENSARISQDNKDIARVYTVLKEKSALEEPRMTMTKQRGNRNSRIGIVTSDKMDKTVVVKVEQMIKHPVYKKYIKRNVKFKAHDSENACTTGD